MGGSQYFSAPGSPSGSARQHWDWRDGDADVPGAMRKPHLQQETINTGKGKKKGHRKGRRRNHNNGMNRQGIPQYCGMAFPGDSSDTGYPDNPIAYQASQFSGMNPYGFSYQAADGCKLKHGLEYFNTNACSDSYLLDPAVMTSYGAMPNDVKIAPYYVNQSFVPYSGWDASVYAQQTQTGSHVPGMYASAAPVAANAIVGQEVWRRSTLNEVRTQMRSRSFSSPDQYASVTASAALLGSLWTSSALPAIEDKKDDAPDLERFLKSATPRFKISTDSLSLRDFKLLDVWKHFEKASAFGMKCPTLGGPRGPSTCYFVPFLSCVHIYETVNAPGRGKLPQGTFSYPEGLDTWPKYMKRRYNWSAKDHVGERLPFHQQVMDLCGSSGLEHTLAASKISELHPYSWFAVAWYPLYRIPEAPLTARFLTFHSFAPLWEAVAQSTLDRDNIPNLHAEMMNLKIPEELPRPQTGAALTPKGVIGVEHFPGSPLTSDATRTPAESSDGSSPAEPAANSDTASVTASYGSTGPPTPEFSAGEEEEEEEEKCMSCAATTVSSTASLSKIELPPVGLCWHTSGNAASSRKSRGENWIDTMVKVNASGHTVFSSGDSLPGSTNACVVSAGPGNLVVKKDYPLSKGGPLSWDIQMEELTEGAKRLALGTGLHLEEGEETEPVSDNICPDYQFFLSRYG